MKTKFIYTYIFLALLSFSSCTEVVDVTVPNGGERLVVEASILWEKGTSGNNQVIKLSKSTEYFSDNLDNPVIGAVVTVTNTNTGEVFNFTDEANGNYSTTTFVPVINNTYDLNIQYNGQTYTATETFAKGPEIIRVEQKLVSGFGGDELSVLAYYQDPENENNFYFSEFKSNRYPLISLEPTSDEFFNGNENFTEYEGETLEVGDEVTISLHGISEDFFYYIDLLSSQSGEGGGFFASTPAPLKGNCINPNNPNEEVLGYFRLNEVAKTTYILQ